MSVHLGGNGGGRWAALVAVLILAAAVAATLAGRLELAELTP